MPLIPIVVESHGREEELDGSGSAAMTSLCQGSDKTPSNAKAPSTGRDLVIRRTSWPSLHSAPASMDSRPVTCRAQPCGKASAKPRLPTADRYRKPAYRRDSIVTQRT